MSYATWDIGNNKQIKYGNDWYADDNDPLHEAHLFVTEDGLATLLRQYEPIFIDQFHNLNLMRPRWFQPVKLPSYGSRHGILTPWNYENPPLDPQREAILQSVVDRLAQIGIVKEVLSRPDFLNPVDIIYENDEWKLWPDFTNLREFIRFHKNATRDLADNIFSIPTSAVFTKLVVKDACFQIELNEECKKFTSFKIRNGNTFRYFQFNTLHPNIDNAIDLVNPRLLRILEPVLSGSVKTFNDQILICTQDFDFHRDHLNGVLHFLHEANVKLSLRESLIFVKQVELCDFCVDERGLSIPISMKNKIQNLEPTSFENREWFRKICILFGRFATNPELNPFFNAIRENRFRIEPLFYNFAANQIKIAFINSNPIPFRRRVSLANPRLSST